MNVVGISGYNLIILFICSPLQNVVSINTRHTKPFKRICTKTITRLTICNTYTLVETKKTVAPLPGQKAIRLIVDIVNFVVKSLQDYDRLQIRHHPETVLITTFSACQTSVKWHKIFIIAKLVPSTAATSYKRYHPTTLWRPEMMLEEKTD